MFYLDRDVPLAARARDLHRLRVGAHGDLAGAVLARASTSSEYGDGRVEGIFSVDISEWERPGAAHRQGRDGVHARGDPRGGVGAAAPTTSTTADPVLDEANVLTLVPRPRDRVPEPDRGDEPRAAADQHGRLVGRPARTPSTRIPNLFLAADFVRTHTDLATMEGANEAARRAVNAILGGDAARARRAAASGSCASRRSSAPSGRSTGCAGGSAARPARAPVRVTEDGELERGGPLARVLPPRAAHRLGRGRGRRVT